MARSRMVSESSGHHGALGDVVDPAEAVTPGARALHRVGRERLGVEDVLARRVVARAGVEHAEEVGERGDAADRRARGGRAALLLEGDGGREAVDRVDLGNAYLMEEAPGVRRHRLEIAALGLGVDGAEGERGLAAAADAGEHDQRAAGDADVDVLEVVDPGAADVDEAVGNIGHRGVYDDSRCRERVTLNEVKGIISGWPPSLRSG